jgi:hypothetical protein
MGGKQVWEYGNMGVWNWELQLFLNDNNVLVSTRFEKNEIN